MDIEGLALLLAVVRCGSLTRAGAAFGFNQSTVTRRLKRLEDEWGVTLVDRSQTPVVLTDAGVRVARFAEEVLRHRDALKGELSRAAVRGELRLAASSAPAAALVPSLVSRFLAQYPEVHVRLQVTATRAVESIVSAGRATVGFTGAEPVDPCLHGVVVGRDAIRLVLPDRPPYDTLPDPVPLAVLETLPFVERDEGSGTLATVRRAVSQAGNMKLAVVLRVDSAEAALAATAAGVGATFASASLLQRHDPHGVRVVGVEGIRLSRPLFMVYDPLTAARDPVAGRFRAFVEVETKTVREQG
jgi:DNA-binding transcriptional LysR family regulator